MSLQEAVTSDCSKKTTMGPTLEDGEKRKLWRFLVARKRSLQLLGEAAMGRRLGSGMQGGKTDLGLGSEAQVFIATDTS